MADPIPLLMTDMVPLRRAMDLPTYRADAASQYLPWVFGHATVNAIPLEITGTEWLVADHPIVGVTRVMVAGKETTSWQLQQRVDATGQAVSVIVLGSPTVSGTVVVSLAGRKHPITGALLTPPGDIVREIMRLCNHTEPAGSWEGLDDNYGQVELALALTTPQVLRAVLASVIEPLYAMWRPQWASPQAPGTPVATLNVTNTSNVSVRMDNTTLATVLRVAYAFDWSANASRGTLRLGAPDARERWGDIVVDVSLPTVRRARDALTFASARLVDGARTTWLLTADVDDRIGDLLAGQTLSIDHPQIPAGLAVITALAHDREQAMFKVTAVMRTESAPRVEMLRLNTAIDPTGATDPITSYLNGVATFTVYDAQGNPLANAFVTLDSLHTANTDATGRVQFTTPRGPHTLTVSATGFATFELDVVV